MLPLKKVAVAAVTLILPATLLAAPAGAEEAKSSAKETKAAEKAPAPSDTLVRVNGTAITRLDVARAVKVLLSNARTAQPLPPEIQKQAEAQALEQLTAAELLYQEGSKTEIKDLDKQVAEKIAENKARMGSADDFEKMLKQLDLTQKDINDFTRKEIVISTFIEKRFASKATVSDEEALAFYQDNLKKYFTQSESVRASHILIGTAENASAEEKGKAKEKASALLKKVKEGADFAALAKSDSTCPSSAQGGDLGTFSRGQMVPSFEQAAFTLKPGELSEVVETQFGYHIIKVTEKKEGSVQKFEEVKGKIVEYLKGEKTQKTLAAYLDELKAKAKIERL